MPIGDANIQPGLADADHLVAGAQQLQYRLFVKRRGRRAMPIVGEICQVIAGSYVKQHKGMSRSTPRRCKSASARAMIFGEGDRRAGVTACTRRRKNSTWIRAGFHSKRSKLLPRRSRHAQDTGEVDDLLVRLHETIGIVEQVANPRVSAWLRHRFGDHDDTR